MGVGGEINEVLGLSHGPQIAQCMTCIYNQSLTNFSSSQVDSADDLS